VVDLVELLHHHQLHHVAMFLQPVQVNWTGQLALAFIPIPNGIMTLPQLLAKRWKPQRPKIWHCIGHVQPFQTKKNAQDWNHRAADHLEAQAQRHLQQVLVDLMMCLGTLALIYRLAYNQIHYLSRVLPQLRLH